MYVVEITKKSAHEDSSFRYPRWDEGLWDWKAAYRE